MSKTIGRLTSILVLSVGCGLVWGVARQGDAEPSSTRARVTLVAISADPARIEGHGKCVDCHKQEVKAWLQSKHASRSFDLLRTAPSALEYAKNLGVRTNELARTSLCVNCHATPRLNAAGRASVIGGVSCEACHGASGGEDGWLNRHAVYGPVGTRREEETPEHYERRHLECNGAGQLRCSDLYLLAKRCFQCHVVGNEDLAIAGHDHGDRFDFAARMLGEVRHNFALNQHENAEVATLWTQSLHGGGERTAVGRKRVVFIVGQLVDLEVSLRNLATASEENEFTDMMFDRIEAAFELLGEDILEELEDTEIPEVERAIEAVEPVWESLDDDGFSLDETPNYTAAAEIVSQAAKAFSLRDGSKLAELDALELLPDAPTQGIYQP